MTTQPTTTTRGARLARRARPLLAAYGLVMLVVVLSPSSTVQAGLVMDLVRACDRVLPVTWVTFVRAEVAINAVIVAPLSLLGRMAFPGRRWQDWTAYGFLAASTVELTQGLFLPGRQASFSDVVANTAGALLGALLAAPLVATRTRRRDDGADV